MLARFSRFTSEIFKMRGFVQILGTATIDTTPSLLVFFDNQRYLFDVGEGTQRFCLEHKVKLGKIDNIFLTRIAWEQVGGLPGMLLTVSDIGTPSVSLCGPPGLLNFLTSTRYFLQRPNFHMDVTEFDLKAPQPYQDELLRALPVIIDPHSPLPSSSSPPSPSLSLPPPANLVSKYFPTLRHNLHPTNPDSTKPPVNQVYLSRDTPDGDKNGKTKDLSNKDEEEEEKWVNPAVCAHLHSKLKRSNVNDGFESVPYSSDVVACYICRSPDIPGKFDVKKAKALGVPVGPMFGILQKGNSVIVPGTGNEVTPDQCMDKPTPGPVFVVIQCPSAAYVPHIIHNDSFTPFHTGAKQTQPVAFVIHFTSQDSLTSPDYKAWMAKFGPNTEHIVINKDVCPHNYVFCSTSEHQFKLNHIDSDLFPLPHIISSFPQLPEGLPVKTHKGENLMQLHFAPVSKQGIDRSEVLKTDTETCKKAINDLYLVNGFSEGLVEYKNAKSESKDDGPQIVFLGTGSAIPSKYRNVSSIYFEPAPKCGILLDAGEGSYGQLYRRFGDKLNEVVQNLKLVWISHIHADHHLGLIRFLIKRQEFSKAPLLVIGPRLVGRWLAEYNHVQPLNYEFVDCTEILQPENKLKETTEKLFGFTSFFNIEVLHCPEAFGLIVTHKDGWKLVYSGDTRPCPALEEAGKNATVLIHEATLEEGMEEDALDKGHSTTTQAITSGLKMGAEAILLTHFSQRYPKIPTLDSGHKKVSVAFDLLSVNWARLPRLPNVVPLLSHVFEEQRVEAEKNKEKNREKMAEEKKAKKVNKKL